jgi:hypothetical protein
MKHRFTIAALLFAHLLVAQNSYHTIVTINTENRWLISLAANSVEIGQRVMIYQFGGATMQTTGNAIGSINDLGGAGHYDLNEVIGIRGDTLFLALPILHDYLLSKTHLVVSPPGPRLVIDEPVQVLPFDGSKGGVLFLASRESLTINTTLSANGAGFRGGQGIESDSDCSRFTVAAHQHPMVVVAEMITMPVAVAAAVPT